MERRGARSARPAPPTRSSAPGRLRGSRGNGQENGRELATAGSSPAGVVGPGAVPELEPIEDLSHRLRHAMLRRRVSSVIIRPGPMKQPWLGSGMLTSDRFREWIRLARAGDEAASASLARE